MHGSTALLHVGVAQHTNVPFAISFAIAAFSLEAIDFAVCAALHPLHDSTSHVFISTDDGHALPPNAAAVFTGRSRRWLPAPQVLLHLAHFDQGPTTQSTAQGRLAKHDRRCVIFGTTGGIGVGGTKIKVGSCGFFVAAALVSLGLDSATAAVGAPVGCGFVVAEVGADFDFAELPFLPLPLPPSPSATRRRRWCAVLSGTKSAGQGFPPFNAARS
jgi:hypothetical protein